MIAINSGGIPLWAAKLLIHSGATLNELVSKNAWYFLGQDDYQVPDFENNALMQSPVRFKRFTSLYQQTPNLRLGGVTYQWLSQAGFANVAVDDSSLLTVRSVQFQALIVLVPMVWIDVKTCRE